MCVVREQQFQGRLVHDTALVDVDSHRDTSALHFERCCRDSLVPTFPVHVVSLGRFVCRSGDSHGWWLVDFRCVGFIARDGYSMTWPNNKGCIAAECNGASNYSIG